MVTEQALLDVRTADASWRIAPESDTTRGQRELFTPVRQSIFWLRKGENPNVEDYSLVHEPFTLPFTSTADREVYERGIKSMLQLYAGTFTTTIRDDGAQVIVGNYESQRGSPAIVITPVGKARYIEHTWLQTSVGREARLR